MSDSDAKYLDTFPQWLRNLGEDAEHLAGVLEQSAASSAAREAIAGGLNYLFKSLDLIPDGIDDIGFLDDAFVLRVAAELATKEGTKGLDEEPAKALERLADEADVVREFLGTDYGRLETYVRGLRKRTVRGRTPDEIVTDTRMRSDFVSDVRGFARSYSSPSFAREEKNLIKLRAFLDAKLPR